MAVRKIVQAKKDVDPNWDYCGVHLTIHNIIIPEERLNPTPSQLDNLDWESEVDLRIVGCELIQDSGVLLRLPQVAMATAQVIYQRFYYSKSFVRHFYEHYAMACVFLSAKLEECPRRIRDVINVFNHIRQVREKKSCAPIMLDQNYINLKNQVIKAERRVLKELGFCVHAKHPHKWLVISIHGRMYVHPAGKCRLVQCEQLNLFGANYMNDSLRTDMFVRYLPEAIACGCIYLASCKLNIPLPRNPAWWEMFHVSDESVHEIALCLLRLYARPKPDVAVLENRLAKLRKDQLEIKEREYEKRKVAHAMGVPSTGSDHSSDGVSPLTVAKNVSITTLNKQKSIKHLISTITSTNNSKLNNNFNNAFLVHSEVKAVSINLKSQPPDESGTCIDSGEVEMDVSDQETIPIKSANIDTLGDHKHKKSPNCETNRHVPVSSESQVRPAAYSNIQSRFNDKVNNKERSSKKRRSISDSSSSGSDRQKRENTGMNGRNRHYRRRGRNPSDQSSSAPDSELDKHRDASQFENHKYDKKRKRKHVSRSSTDASRHSSSDSDDSRMNIPKRRNGSHSRSRQYSSSYRSRRSHKIKHRSSRSHQDGSSISTNDDYSRSRASSNRHVHRRK